MPLNVNHLGPTGQNTSKESLRLSPAEAIAPGGKSVRYLCARITRSLLSVSMVYLLVFLGVWLVHALAHSATWIQAAATTLGLVLASVVTPKRTL